MYGVDPEKDGAEAYYNSIFALYASWDVDFIKCDDICRELPHEETELRLISKALRGCGRSMVFSLSPGPAHYVDTEFQSEGMNVIGERLKALSSRRRREAVFCGDKSAVFVHAKRRKGVVFVAVRRGFRPLNVNNDILPAVLLQIFRHEIGVCTNNVLRNGRAVAIPAIPAHWGSFCSNFSHYYSSEAVSSASSPPYFSL